MQLSSHQKRLATAFVLPLPLILAMILGGWTLFAVLLLFCLPGLWEFYSLFWPGGHNLGLKIGGLGAAVVLLVACTRPDPVWLLLALMAAMWAGNLYFLSGWSRRGTQAAYGDSLVFFGGLAYVPLALHFFLRWPPLAILLALAAAVATDTGAFYAGSYLGKAKIWPSVSPKKTWMGSAGGLAACMAATAGLGAVFGDAPLAAWLALGIWLNLAAQFGDFFESAIKRKLEVKDSGSILPGHGGLLDRIDSLLLVAPAYALAVALFPDLLLFGGVASVCPPLAGPLALSAALPGM
ncbi:MAG: phosphatidate cytidylyltransferase [Desulfovibrionaceae bacterium]